MSNPSNVVAQEETPETKFKNQVDQVVGKFETGADGTITFPKDLELTTEVKFAAMAEKRRRDTRAELQKTQTLLATADKIRENLESQVAGSVKLTITSEEQQTLDDLKDTDPEEWRRTLNKLENEAQSAATANLATMTAEARSEVELASRTQQLEVFNLAHPDGQINDDVLANDIPPRLTNQLASGALSFGEFLAQARDYISKDKVIASGKGTTQTSLSDLAGGSDPSESAKEHNSIKKYEQEIF